MAFTRLTAVLCIGLILADKGVQGVVDPFAGENGTNETELVYLGITPAPTPAPTATPAPTSATPAPTPAPTVKATPAPTEAEEDGASSTSAVGALLATIAALGVTGFF
eukprot:TRINITY_DN2544_c0_g1_i2.p2 TRINITY_DN2544_c0_g1~~TRINITY_DN2544_c0_g1_i2.p2  ORF type:complete len:108 (-),score=26.68 TRINITY_DN2544_c0_g1_i2:208-531(-)